MAPLTSSSRILIVGAGTWGSSTALHLTRRGYKNVTLLDSYPMPSSISAGNDVNKIAEITSFSDENGDPELSAKLFGNAAKGWYEDPIFKPHFHETGVVMAASTPETQQKLLGRVSPALMKDAVMLESAEDFRRTMPNGVLTGEFPNYRGFWKKSGTGWIHARNALLAAAKEAKRLGAEFIGGTPQGKVTELVFETGDVVGAKTADGVVHRCDRLILCAGANADQLLDFKNQLRPTAWTLAHIKMTQEEAQIYKNLPVLFNIEKGFFMEPDEDSNELKMCDEHPGYCNWIVGKDGEKTSVPFMKDQIPKEAEDRLRGFLRDVMPHLANRPFSFARVCWCADSQDREFIISRHPEYKSLTVAAGDSGHGFVHIPVVGGYVVDSMEDKLDEQLAKVFRWRPETAVNRDFSDTQGRFGGPNKVMDFQEVQEWTTIKANL